MLKTDKLVEVRNCQHHKLPLLTLTSLPTSCVRNPFKYVCHNLWSNLVRKFYVCAFSGLIRPEISFINVLFSTRRVREIFIAFIQRNTRKLVV